MSDAERKARAKARRARITLHKALLGAVEHDLSPISGPAAVSLVHRLSLEAWSLSGRQLPSYTRAEIPVRFVRGRLT